jgi:hypothetical protein
LAVLGGAGSHLLHVKEEPSGEDQAQEQTLLCLYNIIIMMFTAFSDPDPHGSALNSLSWVRIQEQENLSKLTNKPDFQPFKMAYVSA